MMLEKAREFVAAFEGLRLEPYRDQAGLWTIGYGHRCESFQTPISAGEAERILLGDLGVAAACVEALPVELTEGQQIALVSFIFNVGAGAFRASTLRMKLVDNDFEGAAGEFTRWVYVTIGGEKIVSQGLVTRRAKEKQMFIGGGVDKKEGAEVRMTITDVLANKLKEPSTWRGIGGLLAALGLVSAGSVNAVVAVGAALLSLVEVVRAEK